MSKNELRRAESIEDTLLRMARVNCEGQPHVCSLHTTNNKFKR